MEIAQRGRPPYRVSSGLIKDSPESPEQWATRATFYEALLLIFDLSDGGLSPAQERIVDTTNTTVFTTATPEDVAILRQMDQDGVFNTKVV